MAGPRIRVSLTLADYQDRRLSPPLGRRTFSGRPGIPVQPVYARLARRIEALVEENAPDAVGLSLNYLSQALGAFALLGFVRYRFPGLRPCWGRARDVVAQANGRPQPLRGLVDHCVSGPGEGFLPVLQGSRPAGCVSPAPTTAGSPGDYLSPGPVPPSQRLVGLSLASLHLLPRACRGAAPSGPSWRRRSSRTSARSSRTCGPALIHVLDSTMSPRLLEHLALRPPGALVRVHPVEPPAGRRGDFCRGPEGLGCVMLKLGLESGDQGVLDALEKGIRVDEAPMALRP